MNLIELEGIKVRITFYDGRSVTKDRRIGEVVAATNSLIVVRYENYNESFNIGTIVANGNIKIEYKDNGEWINLRTVISRWIKNE